MATNFPDSRKTHRKAFGRERPVHAVLGGGKVADVLLWRNKHVSAALLVGVTILWFLFEVVEYNLVPLFCHIAITLLLLLFISCTLSNYFNWTPPVLPKNFLDERQFEQAAHILHTKFHQLLSKLFDVACGNDLPRFVLAIFSLWVLSLIGSVFSFVNLLFVGLLCMETLPFLYEMYEEDVDYLVGKMIQDVEKLYIRFDSNFMSKIPRGPVKEKKTGVVTTNEEKAQMLVQKLEIMGTMAARAGKKTGVPLSFTIFRFTLYQLKRMSDADSLRTEWKHRRQPKAIEQI